MNPFDALNKLKEGNTRFINNTSEKPNQTLDRLKENNR